MKFFSIDHLVMLVSAILVSVLFTSDDAFSRNLGVFLIAYTLLMIHRRLAEIRLALSKAK